MDEGLQGAGHQVVVMVKEAGVAVFLALEQVLVVAAGVQLPGERRCLRHVVLQGERGGVGGADTEKRSGRGASVGRGADVGTASGIRNSRQTQTQTAEVCMGNGLDAVDSLSSAGYDRLAFQLSSFSALQLFSELVYF